MAKSEQLRTMLKVNKVIASCRTFEQFEVAKKYLELYKNRYPFDDRAYNILLDNLISMQQNIRNVD